MNSLAVQTRNLSFSFSKRSSLFKDLSLNIPKGSAFGLLGPNGSGKSTLFKLLLGLIKPQNGKVFLFGQPPTPSLFHNIGSLIDGPKLYHHLSAFDNLKVFAIYRGIPEKSILSTLKTIGLQHVALRKVQQFSMGMKQRLAIGIALLPDPELLVLDEPINGLDPQGIAEIRQLILRLNQEQGKTILISSHILHEIEQSCSHIGIIKNGELLFQGKKGELKSQIGFSEKIKIDVQEKEQAQKILERKGFKLLSSKGQAIVLSIDHPDEISVIIDLLRSEEILIYQVQRLESTLEDYFLKLLA